MRRRPLRARIAAVVAAISTATVLAACSSPAGSDAGAGGTGEPVTVRIAELSTANYLTLGRASGLVDKGLQGVGAKAEWLGPFPNPVTSYETFFGGQADAGSTGASTLTVWSAADRDVVAYAVEKYNGDSQGIVAAPGSGVTSLRDLYGKKVAVGASAGSTGAYILEKAFEHAGLDSSQVEKVFLAGGDTAAAFAKGEIAAWSSYDQFFATAQSTPGAVVLARGDQIGSHNASIHFVNRAIAQNHPEIVRALYDSLVAQAEAAHADPSIITKAYAAAGANQAVTDVVAKFDIPTIVPVDAEALANLQALAEEYVRYGFAQTVGDLEKATVDVTTLG